MAADIPLSGTSGAAPGTQIEARAVPEAGSPTPWQVVATVTADGTFSGLLSGIEKSTRWYTAQIRHSGDASTVSMTSRFAVGHVLAVWGQSEVHYMLKAFEDQVSHPAVTDDAALQIVYPADTVARTPTRHFVTDADPLTGAMAAMSNIFSAHAPGEKFALIWQVQEGTGFDALVGDGIARNGVQRDWAKDKAIHDLATADGQSVGLALASWFAAPGWLADRYEDALFPVLFGKLSDGSPIPELTGGTPADTYVHDFGGPEPLAIDHTMEALYDYTHTRWLAYGPHVFAPTETMLNATDNTTGTRQDWLYNKQLARLSWRDMAANPHGAFAGVGIEPLNYKNGETDGAGGWTDIAHPSADTPDGVHQLAKLTAAAALQGLGLTAWGVPQFDRCTWAEDGSQVEIWSSAGDITTTRIARGAAALPATYPHWSEVVGFQINGTPAQHANIVAGRVRITPNDGGTFTGADVLTFGEGGASGMLQIPEDFENDLWMNRPIVDVGLPGLDGIAVSAMPQADILANTISDGAVPTSFAAMNMSGVSAFNAAFRSTENVAAGNAMTIESWVRVNSASGGFATVHGLADGYFDLRVFGTGGGALRVNLRDAAGTYVYNNHTVPDVTLPLDQWVRVVTAVDMVAGDLAIYLNGAELTTLSFTPTGQGLAANRKADIIRGAGSSQSGLIDIGSYRHWLSVAPTPGEIPTGTADETITEGADWANHPWRTTYGALS